MWKEQHLYGSSRLGIWKAETRIQGTYKLNVAAMEQSVREYELTNHLGNVLATITDKGVITSAQAYYPFGLTLASRSFTEGGSSYRYSFNGKEDDKALGNIVDFGDRFHSPKLSRWFNVDKLAKNYPSSSPYVFALNTPIQAIDPDGQKVIFVNGYYGYEWADNISGGQIGHEAGEKYWGPNFLKAAKRYLKDESAYYVDGAKTFVSSGGYRYDAGYEYAKANYGDIVNGIFDENGVQKETVKIVTHSMGAAYAEGMIKYLDEKKIKIEKVIHLAPANPNGFNVSANLTVQLNIEADPVLVLWSNDPTVSDKIDGVDKYGKVSRGQRNAAGLDMGAHADTKWSASIFSMIEDLENIQFKQIGNTMQTPVGTFTGPSNQYESQGTTNGTNFKEVSKNGDTYKNKGDNKFQGPVKQ